MSPDKNRPPGGKLDGGFWLMAESAHVQWNCGDLRRGAFMCIYVHQMCSDVRSLCIYVRPCAGMCGHVQSKPGHDAARSVCHSDRCPLFSALSPLIPVFVPFAPFCSIRISVIRVIRGSTPLCVLCPLWFKSDLIRPAPLAICQGNVRALSGHEKRENPWKH